MKTEDLDNYNYEPIYSQSDIDEWIRLVEDNQEQIRELKAENELLKQITAEIPLDRLKELKGE